MKSKSFRNFSSFLPPLSDNEESMQFIRKLLKEKESLEKCLKILNEECDIMLSFIGCSSHEEREALTEEWFSVQSLRMSPSILDEEVLQSFVYTKKMNIVHRFLGVKVRKSDKGEIIIEFLSPEDYVPPSPAFITLESIDGVYKLSRKILPSVVPTQELEEGNKAALIFITQKYVWSFWMRDKHIQKVKDLPYMNDSIIYYNNNRTLLTFSIFLVGKFEIEVKMKYEPLFTIPYEVTYTEFENKILPSDIISKLDELKESLLIYPFSVVIKQVMGTDSDSSGTIIGDIQIFINQINENILALHMAIRKSIQENHSGDIHCYVLTNNLNNEMTKMYSSFSKPELAFVKQLIETLITSEGCCISVTYAVNSGSLLETKVGAVAAEALIDKLVHEKWILHNEGKLTLGCLTVCELQSYLQQNFDEECSKCYFCKEYSFMGYSCPDCHTKGHRSCLQNYWKRLKRNHCCPNTGCKAEWHHIQIDERKIARVE